MSQLHDDISAANLQQKGSQLEGDFAFDCSQDGGKGNPAVIVTRIEGPVLQSFRDKTRVAVI